jgi:quercetin dioxygenase-like cupin family protein
MKLSPLLLPLPLLLLQGCYTPKEPAPQKIKVEVLKKDTKSWNGNRLANYPKGQPEITITKITIPPHTALPMHKHPAITSGILLKGTLTVTTDRNETITINEGDPLIEVYHQWHYGANNSDEPAEILAVYAGAKGVPTTIMK